MHRPSSQAPGTIPWRTVPRHTRARLPESWHGIRSRQAPQARRVRGRRPLGEHTGARHTHLARPGRPGQGRSRLRGGTYHPALFRRLVLAREIQDPVRVDQLIAILHFESLEHRLQQVIAAHSVGPDQQHQVRHLAGIDLESVPLPALPRNALQHLDPHRRGILVRGKRTLFGMKDDAVLGAFNVDGPAAFAALALVRNDGVGMGIAQPRCLEVFQRLFQEHQLAAHLGQDAAFVRLGLRLPLCQLLPFLLDCLLLPQQPGLLRLQLPAQQRHLEQLVIDPAGRGLLLLLDGGDLAVDFFFSLSRRARSS